MTSPAILQAAASTRTAPSREFMVQQAVLNAAYIKCGWTGWRLQRWLGSQSVSDRGTFICNPLLAVAIAQFNLIAAEYSVAP